MRAVINNFMNDEYYPEDFIDPEYEEQKALEEVSEDEAAYFESIANDIDELLTMKLPDLRKFIFKI